MGRPKKYATALEAEEADRARRRERYRKKLMPPSSREIICRDNEDETQPGFENFNEIFAAFSGIEKANLRQDYDKQYNIGSSRSNVSSPSFEEWIVELYGPQSETVGQDDDIATGLETGCFQAIFAAFNGSEKAKLRQDYDKQWNIGSSRSNINY
ncbi:hypothetical protein DdX_19765 [Ditylenchus destructor]|uniref:Uncharacterized protein n=1 Tax=Ditylenchus destructor TaxID=166010 RepID=A0AAD4QS60_9BILA|nr:hypothetical protein DdX_19765 [Ditylenchus destructor]